jgi:hypothetical protein
VVPPSLERYVAMEPTPDTILVDQETVTIIRAQQQWADQVLAGRESTATAPKYLFLAARTNRNGVYRSETRPQVLTCDFVRRGIDDRLHATGHDPVVRLPDPSSGIAADHPGGAR